jgi:DNA polymerase-3 subunit delta
MLNSKFNREVQKGLPDPVYFFFSKESIMLEQVLSEAVSTVIRTQQKDFNYDVFYPSASSQEILDASLTLPFLSARRLVVIKNYHEFSLADTEPLMRYFEKPCESTCMIVLTMKEPKFKINIPWHIYSFNVRERDIPAWIKQLTLQKGIEISENAVEYLIETVGPDIGLLAMEIGKLALFGSKKIETHDVISSVGTTREYIPFHLVDALIAGKKTRAFKILRSLVKGGPSHAPVVLGALNWHYTQFYSLWAQKGKRPPKMRETTYKNLITYLPRFHQEDFITLFQYIHEADKDMKTSARPELTLEVLLIKLLQIGARN